MTKQEKSDTGLLRGQQLAYAKVQEIVAGMKKGSVKGEDKEWSIHYMGYDEALADLSTAVSKEQEKR